MSVFLLWWNRLKQQLLTNQRRPSPKGNRWDAIEGIPIFPFFKKKCAASMTVEAAMILPLFLFVFLYLSSAMEMIRLHSNMELALWSIGNRLSVYGHVLTQEKNIEEQKRVRDSEWGKQIAGVAFSYTYVRQEVKKYLGEDYLNSSPMIKGAKGMQFLESDMLSGKDDFEIVVSYGVAPDGGLLEDMHLGMVNHYYGHIWNGYEISIPSESDTDTELVYVTATGTVYHEDRNCSHIKLKILEVTPQEAALSRNDQGAKYYPCEICGKTDLTADKVWITTDGNRIHYNRDCSGLIRMIRVLEKTKAIEKGYRPCSRCAN